MIDITLKVCPPSITAQQKRVHFVKGKPVFFHGARMQREVSTWAALLAPFTPTVPMDGALVMSVRLVWPHLKATPKRDRVCLIPKVTRPDVDGAAKHLVDQFTRLRFIVDDARISRLVLEKFWGPDEHVGIYIRLCAMTPKALLHSLD